MPFPNKTTGSPIRAKVVGQYRDELLPLLSEYPVEILDTDSSETPGLVFSYGGDGTLLGAERDFPGIPKLPLRDKSHNPRCQRHCERQCLDAFFEGRIALAEYMKLRASVHGRELTALNDIVLERRLHPLGAIRFQQASTAAPRFPGSLPTRLSSQRHTVPRATSKASPVAPSSVESGWHTATQSTGSNSSSSGRTPRFPSKSCEAPQSSRRETARRELN